MSEQDNKVPDALISFLEIEYDPISDIIKIEGTCYHGGLFRELGCNFPSMVGQVLRVDKKENNLVTVTRLVDYDRKR